MTYSIPSLRSLIELTCLPLLWLSGMLAAFSIHRIGIGTEHSICGPWGCGPPTNALLAVHLGWLSFLGPPLIFLPWRFQWRRRVTKRLGIGLTFAGLAGILGIIAWQWFVWLPQAGEWSKPFLLQRCGFCIATTVDWPFIQLLVIGIALLFSRTHIRRAIHPVPRSEQSNSL